MDIMFREVRVKSIEGSSYNDRVGFLDIHLANIEADDLILSLSGETSHSKFIESFLMDHASYMDERQKEEILEEIGEKFCQKYWCFEDSE